MIGGHGAVEKSRADRRLAAILMADVVAYSRLMELDEAGIVASLKAYQTELLEPLLREHRGRVVNQAGDSVLCEFGSAVDAVACAVALQTGMAKRAALGVAGEPVQLRVGINLGEVLVQGADIYGDGVNVAARLQSLARPGGICVSGKVRDEVEGKLAFPMHDFGRHRVKNIKDPVSVFAVGLDPAASHGRALARQRGSGWWRRRVLVAASAAAALSAGGVAWLELRRDESCPAATAVGPPLPDEPPVAVLPFDDLSPARNQGYFADGITEELITGLAKFPDLMVIARNSTFTYKGKAVDVRQIGRELAVHYVVEGSIQREDDEVRVVAQLINANTGYHLWAESYDRQVNGILVIRDDITQSIVGTLMGTRGRLAEAEVERLAEKSPASFTAYDYLMQGWYEWHKFTRPSNMTARNFFLKAKTADPNYARAYAGLA